MKKLTLIWIMALFALQSDAQQLQKPAAGKCIVYFTRVTSMGVAINFKYFDGEKYLGKFNGRKYMIYECDPGRHLFWARSENNDYVEAELDTGRIYLIDSDADMGALKARVVLIPYDKSDVGAIKFKMKIEKLIAEKNPETFSEMEIRTEEQSLRETIEKGIEKYNKLKADKKVITVITPEMTYD